MGRLDGRVALLSGAARGQGAAEAARFAAEGACVVLGDVLDEECRAVAEAIGDRARWMHLDVTDEGSWAEAVRHATDAFGKIDALVNNAGIVRFGTIADTTLAEYLDVVGVNQVGVLLGMRAVVEPMRVAGGGTIVNVASVNGRHGTPGTVAYTASKFAVVGMTKVAALELGPHIRVNAILPGGVDTPMVRRRAGAAADEIAAGFPLGRLGRPEEIADLALFLTSDESSYCTGADFVIDGGMTAGPSGR